MRCGFAVLALLAGVCTFPSPTLAQDDEGLGGGPILSRRALELEGRLPAEDSTTALPAASPSAASRSAPTAQVTRGEVRQRRAGLAGALLGEKAEGTYELRYGVGANPSVQGTQAEENGYVTIEGRPFIKGAGDSHAAALNDIQQGQLGDCYLLASLAAVARTHPDVLEGMITDHGDGTYTVRLFEPPLSSLREWLHTDLGFDMWGTSSFRDIRVDNQFPSDGSGDAAFVQTTGDVDDEAEELWPLLIEKAYAVLKGSYDDIGNGGYGSLALNAINGASASMWHSPDLTIDELDEILTDASQGGDPIVLGTFGETSPGLGLVGSHAYAVSRNADGTYTAYNPWGTRHPSRPMTAAELYQNFYWVWVSEY